MTTNLGVLQYMGSQRVGHDLETEQYQCKYLYPENSAYNIICLSFFISQSPFDKQLIPLTYGISSDSLVVT